MAGHLQRGCVLPCSILGSPVGTRGMFPWIAEGFLSTLQILHGAVGPPQVQAAPWCSCPGGSHESVALPLFLSVVWNPGMGRGPVLHRLVLICLIWGHCGVFLVLFQSVSGGNEAHG